MLLEEVENHVARLRVEGGVHCHFAKEVFEPGNDYRQRAKAVPQVVEGEESLAHQARALVFEGDEGAAQFDRFADVVVDETVGEVEHMARSEVGLA